MPPFTEFYHSVTARHLRWRIRAGTFLEDGQITAGSPQRTTTDAAQCSSAPFLPRQKSTAKKVLLAATSNMIKSSGKNHASKQCTNRLGSGSLDKGSGKFVCLWWKFLYRDILFLSVARACRRRLSSMAFYALLSWLTPSVSSSREPQKEE